MNNFGIAEESDQSALKSCQHHDRKYDVGIQSTENDPEFLNDILRHLELIHPGTTVFYRITNLLSFMYTEFADYKMGIVLLFFFNLFLE